MNMSDLKLMELWGFDDADLGANRLGQLTEKQKNFLLGEHKSQKGVFLGVGVAVVLIFLCLPALIIGSKVILPAILSGDSSITDFLPAGVGVGAMVAVIMPVLAVLAIYVIRSNKQADLTVKHVQGEVKYTWGTKRVRTPTNSASKWKDVKVLHLNLGDRKFEVKESMQEIIQEGEDWKIHYTSYPFKFLSAEKKK
jgi:hypothetical protein